MSTWALIGLALVALWGVAAAAGAGVVLARRYTAQRQMPDAAALERAQQLLAWSQRYKSSMSQLREERAALDASCADLRAQAQALQERLADLRMREIDALEAVEEAEKQRALLKGLRIK